MAAVRSRPRELEGIELDPETGGERGAGGAGRVRASWWGSSLSSGVVRSGMATGSGVGGMGSDMATVREKGDERGCPEGSTRQGCELFQFFLFLNFKQQGLAN